MKAGAVVLVFFVCMFQVSGSIYVSKRETGVSFVTDGMTFEWHVNRIANCNMFVNCFCPSIVIRKADMDTRILLVVLLVKFGGAFEVDLNPHIPSTPDDAFIKFQQAVAEKQKQTPVVFSNLDAYKAAFDSFKSEGSKGDVGVSNPVNVDSNFAKFQKFIVKGMRQYKNFKEFKLRYGLFLNVLEKMQGYNDGGDGLAGINNLADKTLKEKQGLYG